MVQTLDEVVLQPGDSISFANRDDLLETLDRLDRRVPGRGKGRTEDHREHFCIVRYLQFLAGAEHLPLPVTLTKMPVGHDPPDFTLAWPNGREETFELTDGSTREYQKALSLASDRDLTLPVDIDTSEKVAAELWADVLFAAFLKKARSLVCGRFEVDHLLIYDLTGLGLLLPLGAGAPLLRRKIEQWHDRERPSHSFTRISVLEDQALLLDVTGAGLLLRAESPYYRLDVVRADEEDLGRRLRKIDRYCRDHSIRHLKLFGSVLGDRSDGEPESIPGTEGELSPSEPSEHRTNKGTARTFRSDSDLDLLVEFEPGTCVTLLDMARMERELSKLIGFKVDLRTAEDLSRYFRQEVLEQAVELDPAHAGRVG